MKKKAIIRISAALVVLLCAVSLVFFFCPSASVAQEEYTEISLTDLGSPVMAGAGESAVDEDTLYYSSGNTVGYNGLPENAVFTADYFFREMQFPSWFSITVKADKVDRPYSSGLQGYTFIIKPSGECSVIKDGADVYTAMTSAIETFRQYRITVGAVTAGDGVRLLLIIDGECVIDHTDDAETFPSGQWLNFCGEGTAIAQIRSIKRVADPAYDTYTLNTLHCYPIVTGTSSVPTADDDNNLETFDASNCIGFNLHLQNYSFEALFRFKTFEAGRFGMAVRTSGFNRVHGSDGYQIWFYQHGVIELYRGASLIASVSSVPIAADTDYIIEIGAQDLAVGKSRIFACIDKTVYLDYIDGSAVQKPGYLNMNGEGNVTFTATSADTKILPVKTLLTETQDKYLIETAFVNNFSLQSLSHTEFSERILSSVLINGIAVSDLNEIYCDAYGKRVAEMSFSGNRLTVAVDKTMYDRAGEEITFGLLHSFEMKKTRKDGGFISPTGLVLKQSYFVSFA